MSVKRDCIGQIVFVCDESGEEFNTEERDWGRARSALRREGWTAVYDDDEDVWYHYSKECS